MTDLDPSKPLENPKEEKAVLLYIQDKNQSEAYRSAYKSTAKSVPQQACNLFRKPNVRARLAFLTEKELSHLHVTAQRVIQEQARIAFADPARMFDADGNLLAISDMPEDIRRALASVDIETHGISSDDEGAKSVTSKVKYLSKGAALKDLMAHLGLFAADNEQRQLSLYLEVGRSEE